MLWMGRSRLQHAAEQATRVVSGVCVLCGACGSGECVVSGNYYRGRCQNGVGRIDNNYFYNVLICLTWNRVCGSLGDDMGVA